VLYATINLGRCLDLTDAPLWERAFNEAFEELKALYESRGQAVPVNFAKRRYRDCVMFDYLAEKVGADTIRSVALEGRPLFEGTEHRTQQHIQICVRNLRCIELPIMQATEAT